jgi:ABC-type sugar transport system permease subunit
MFDEVFVLTAGGPGDSSTNFGVFLFNQAFTDFRFGYASAAAYVVAAVVFFISLKIMRRKEATS